MKCRNKLIAALLAVAVFLSVFPVTAGAEKTVTGTYQCDWFDESLFYPYEYEDEWFSGSAYEYCHELALLALNVSMASFNSFDNADRDGNIEKMLYTRYVSKEIRRAGGRTKGPKKRTREQDEDFERALNSLLKKSLVFQCFSYFLHMPSDILLDWFI